MRILLGMSGGVDSAYTAKLLIEKGHSVEGAVLKMHGFTDVSSAQRCADALGIPLHVIDCTREFHERVVENFASEYLSGRTPNPCVICNSEVKLRVLYDFAIENGFDKIATGHYARVIKNNERFCIAPAKDKRKDQSYVLWRLPQEILAYLTLPLSDVEKTDVQSESRADGLPSADAKESQEICFIPDNDYAGYIERNFQSSPEGDFVDVNGKVLGRHKGIIHYTVGQRKGLGISLGKRMFVCKINPDDNTVVLSDEVKHTTDEIYVDGLVFSGMAPAEDGEVSLTAKFRYLSPRVEVRVKFLGNGTAKVSAQEGARSVTPGQSAVFYDENGIAFGGIIC